MHAETITTPRQPRIFPLTEQRAIRLRCCVALSDAARLSDLTLSRASLLERHPDRARPGELARLSEGVARAAAERAPR